MNFRLTGIIFAVVLVLLGGLLVSLLVDSGDTVAAPDGLLDPLTRAGAKAADIDTVEIVRTQPSEQKLLFLKVGDRWELREPATAKVDGLAVDTLVRDLFRAAPVRHPELTGSVGVHGLDKPTVRVTLGRGETKATVNVGLTALGGGERGVTFVTTGGAPGRPLAVKRTDLGGLFRENARTKDGPAWELARWLPDFRARRPLGGDLRDAAADATSLKLAGGGKEVALAKEADGWRFTSPANFGPADELGESLAGPAASAFAGVRPLLTALTATQLGVDDYLDKPGDLKEYGLADADAGRVRVELAGLVNGKPAPADVVVLGKPVTDKDNKAVVPAKVYGKFDNDPAVFTLPFDRLDALRATVNDPSALRNRDLLPATARDKVDAIDLLVGGQTIKLRKLPGDAGAAGKWWLFGGPQGPAEAKAGEAESILAALTKSRLAREVLTVPNDPAFAPAEVKAVAKFFTGSTPGKSEPGKPPAEPTVAGSPVELTLGRVAGELAFVRRTAGGLTADLSVRAVDVQPQLVRTRLALLDPKVPGFDPAKATKLTLSTGVEVGKDDKGNWTFAQPANKKGQPADGPRTLGLLASLATPNVVGVASDAPTPDELKKWGLEPPALTATATIDGPDKERRWEFGGPAESGTVYARRAGSPLVLFVRQEQAEALKTTDLRDHTVFQLDPATVTRLTVRGYKGDKGPETYRFEKSGDAWKAVAPTPAGFSPDAAKLTALLTALNTVRAEAFVWLGNQPQYGLDPAVNPEGLEFGLERSAGPPLTLVLGAKAPGEGLVYAASGSVPGEVFTTRLRATIEQFVGRPANFRAAASPVPPPAPPAPAPPPPAPPAKK